MKAYSTDLRQKIIETYENERISQRQLAQRFRVTLSFTAHLPEAQDTWAVLSDQTPYLHTFALYGKRFGGIEPHFKRLFEKSDS